MLNPTFNKNKTLTFRGQSTPAWQRSPSLRRLSLENAPQSLARTPPSHLWNIKQLSSSWAPGLPRATEFQGKRKGGMNHFRALCSTRGEQHMMEQVKPPGWSSTLRWQFCEISTFPAFRSWRAWLCTSFYHKSAVHQGFRDNFGFTPLIKQCFCH